MNQPYPDNIDCAWIAGDIRGFVAVFLTAGIAPIPKAILSDRFQNIEDVEEMVLDAPPISTVRLLVQVKRPDDFVKLAERGFYVFDWTDTGRSIGQQINGYELVAVPGTPIKADNLAVPLAEMAMLVSFTKFAFADTHSIEVKSFFQVEAPSRQ